ncbi:hypothetical protein [Volucribacter amazonae]|uniref:Lipoprotein n=1 Tax=Volucribacter amazonae TaxID=256731 RepID=A0A9X4PI06_9PAST|nr:hypothetical protein [Volucribacter amazonae]MDG6895570.1 hypothetical protein [Volucribacter amazonae]
MNKKFVYILGLSVVLLTSCAAPTTMHQRFEQVSTYLQQNSQPLGNVRFYDVPAADNPISNAIIISTTQVNSSLPSVQQVVEQITQGIPIAVTSASPSLALANVRSAVRSVPQGQNATVYVLAERDEDLEKTASAKGIRLFFVSPSR